MDLPIPDPHKPQHHSVRLDPIMVSLLIETLYDGIDLKKPTASQAIRDALYAVCYELVRRKKIDGLPLAMQYPAQLAHILYFSSSEGYRDE